MAGLERKIARAKGARSDDNPRIYRDLLCGGYKVLHPTKGWRFFSARRLRAQTRMAGLLDGGARR